MTLLDRVVRVLNGHDVAHALIGASALAARGIARSTNDIDIMTTAGRALDVSLWAELRDAHCLVEIRRGDSDDPLA